MKVGVLQFFSWPERRVPLHTVYERALQRIVTMDDAGYDAVWLAEHHFTTYSVCPSVHLMALEAAHRTQRLRIGTAVSLAALYHPLRLAEEVALLDVLTGGRVNWGAGRGFERAEFEAFGVPIEETAARFREAVEVVLAAWRSERLTFHGKYWHFDDVEVLPKPTQRPGPPTWVAATSLDAVSWAASMGYAILMDPHAPFAEIATKYERYCEELSEATGSGHRRTRPWPASSPWQQRTTRRVRSRGRVPRGRLALTPTPIAAALAYLLGRVGLKATSNLASRATSRRGSCGAHRHASATSSHASRKRCTSAT